MPPAYAELIGVEPDLDTSTMAWIQSHGTRKWQEAVQGYLASVSFTDAMIGNLIDALDASGRADNTIIVLWADHGFHLGQKDTVGKDDAVGRVDERPIHHRGARRHHARHDDRTRPSRPRAFMPRSWSWPAWTRPEFVEGTSLVPLLRDPSMSWSDVAITTYGDYGNFAVRDDRYRYIVYANGEEELYDIQADPNQWTNLAADPRYIETRRALAARLPPVAEHAPEFPARTDDE